MWNSLQKLLAFSKDRKEKIYFIITKMSKMPRIPGQDFYRLFEQDYEDQLQSSVESRTGDQLSAVARGAHRVYYGHRKQ